ncbi:MAG: TIGR03619 family F420-dependent LLM class oxidoreductase [Pseudonocardiaceae bacterium]
MSATTATMKLGFGVPFSGPWATFENQVRIATRAEALGYHSLWTFARLLYPLDSDDPRWRLPYRVVPEPIVTLAALAAHTSHIRLGVAVLNIPFYPPAVLAKQLIQLDIVSGGRIDIGAGTGWSEDEYRAIGIPMQRRIGRTTEYLRAIQTIWSAEEAEFSGEFTELPRSLVLPRPVQPHLPVLLGGNTDKALRRAGRLSDGWVSPSFADLEQMGTAIDTVRKTAEEVGKDPDAVRIVCRGSVMVRPPGGQDRTMLSGSLEEIRSDFALLAARGVTELFCDLNFDEQICAPDADPATSMARAEEVLEAFAPAPRQVVTTSA